MKSRIRLEENKESEDTLLMPGLWLDTGIILVIPALTNSKYHCLLPERFSLPLHLFTLQHMISFNRAFFPVLVFITIT